MATWRDELVEVIKSKSEREAEEQARLAKRVAEALVVADEAVAKALDALKFAVDRFTEKDQPNSLEEQDGAHVLSLRGEDTLKVSLNRDDALLTVIYNDGRPREFEFSKDRHISPSDVEEYVGRRCVEMARAAQKAAPW